MFIIEKINLYIIFLVLFVVLFGYSVYRVVRKHRKIHSDLGETLVELVMYLAVYIVIIGMFILKIEIDSIDGVNKINRTYAGDNIFIGIEELNTKYLDTVDGERYSFNIIKIYNSEDKELPKFERVTENYDLSYLGGRIIIKNSDYVYNLYVTEEDFNNLNGETVNKVIYGGF